MPRPKSLAPGYLRHKRTDRAFVLIDGRQIQLGKYDSPESRLKYDQVIARWLGNGRKLPPSDEPLGPDKRPTVAHLILAFWEEYIALGEAVAGELASMRLLLRHLNHFFGAMPIEEFGVNGLRAFREQMIKPLEYQHRVTGERVIHPRGWTRALCSRQIGRVKALFKWGVAHEMVRVESYQALCLLEPLRRTAPTPLPRPPVAAVAEQHVRQVFDRLSRQIRTILEIQLLTGARGNELLIMRGIDIDMSGSVWIYAPEHHKTKWRGHVREIYLGHRCQELIKPFLRTDAQAHLFSPAEAEAERRAAQHARRKTPAGQGNEPGSNRSETPQRPAGDRYTPASYRRAVQRACSAAFAPPDHLQRLKLKARNRKHLMRWETRSEWRARLGEEHWKELQDWIKAHRFHPHQIRHTVAQKLKRLVGLDRARASVGHRSLNMTDQYAGHDRELGIEVAEKFA